MASHRPKRDTEQAAGVRNAVDFRADADPLTTYPRSCGLIHGPIQSFYFGMRKRDHPIAREISFVVAGEEAQQRLVLTEILVFLAI